MRTPAPSKPAWAFAGLSKRARLALMVGLSLILLLVVVLAFLQPPSPGTFTNSPRPAEPVSQIPPDPIASLSSPYPDFAGSESCADCHRDIYDQWKQSTHGRAGGEPGDVALLARFDGTPLRFRDATVTPTTNALGRPVFAVQAAGQPWFEIEVDAVVGGGHMHGGGTQSFFEEFPDGTVRFLPFDFIRDEDMWFVQRRDDRTWVPVGPEISLMNDLANWPPHRVLGSSVQFSNCQNCHGSQITLRYNEAQRRHETRYTSLSVNCESCHGPGRRHVELAKQPGFAERTDIGMASPATLTKDESLRVCFQCHATKDLIRDEPYLPGDPVEEFFSFKLPYLSDNPFLPDGRVARFGYQLNHLYSDCYRNGSMTCVDCHDPHGPHYRDVFGRPLAGRFDDGQCTACHASKAADPAAHTHHAADSAGSRCVACHMPYLQHRGVGTHLAFARSDHSIPIPRPAFDHGIGIENACQKCHADQAVAWQEAKVREWYGELKPHPGMVDNISRARSITNFDEAVELLLQPESSHVMAQAHALIEFGTRFLRPDEPVPHEDAVRRLQSLAASKDRDVQAFALMFLHVAYGRHAEVKSFLARAAGLLGDKETTVRDRWAIAADHWGGRWRVQGDLASALICFQRSVEIDPDNYVAWSHLAATRFQSGETDLAVDAQRRAIAVQPHQAVLYFQLAQMLARLERITEAIAALEEGLRLAPEDEQAVSMLEYLRSL